MSWVVSHTAPTEETVVTPDHLPRGVTELAEHHIGCLALFFHYLPELQGIPQNTEEFPFPVHTHTAFEKGN